MSKFYVVKVGKQPGIYTDWNTTQQLVSGYPGAIYKSFKTLEEAQMFYGDNHNKAIEYDYTIYTDGSSTGGVAGAGVVILSKTGVKKTVYAKVYNVNNGATLDWSDRAELYAVFLALSLCHGVNVKIFSDSRYVVSTLGEYIKAWEMQNWPADKANLDLIKAINYLMKNRTVTYEHIKAHAGHQYNEEADLLANKGAAQETNNVFVNDELYFVV
jgi:ribonuclease HI